MRTSSIRDSSHPGTSGLSSCAEDRDHVIHKSATRVPSSTWKESPIYKTIWHKQLLLLLLPPLGVNLKLISRHVPQLTTGGPEYPPRIAEAKKRTEHTGPEQNTIGTERKDERTVRVMAFHSITAFAPILVSKFGETSWYPPKECQFVVKGNR
uniref:Uncharacterized protein n=1 Tax=Anopheles farauti TaxID=69004 RepID=A0A182QE85_9DIPT